MLILLRLAVAVAAFLVRLQWRSRRRMPTEQVAGIPLWTHESRDKKKRLTRSTAGTPVTTSIHFSLHPEDWADRLFKSFGLAFELQSANPVFNQRVFIASDHPLFADRILANDRFQELVFGLFQQGITQIACDGRELTARIDGGRELDFRHKTEFAELAILLLPKLESVQGWGGQGQDPFLKKAMLAEAITWAIATYGAFGLFELMRDFGCVYPRWMPFFRVAGVVGIAFVACYFWWLKSWLGRSTRLRGVLKATCWLALLTFPLAAIPFVSDFNIELDRSPAIRIETAVLGKRIHVSRGRRGRERRSYYLTLNRIEPERAAQLLGPELQVTYEDFERATEGGRATIHLRSGKLYIPWISQLDFMSEVE
jgi:hypothetical protein